MIRNCLRDSFTAAMIGTDYTEDYLAIGFLSFHSASVANPSTPSVNQTIRIVGESACRI
jgi:hypothetical protein